MVVAMPACVVAVDADVAALDADVLASLALVVAIPACVVAVDAEPAAAVAELAAFDSEYCRADYYYLTLSANLEGGGSVIFNNVSVRYDGGTR